MGRYSTEREVVLQESLRECFRVAKLIGNDESEEALERYSNELCSNFIKNQMIYYSNGQRIIDSWIIRSGDLFDSVIIDNEIPVYEMPTVQLSALLEEQDTVQKTFIFDTKKATIVAALRELGDAVELYNTPSLQELIEASLDDPLQWNAIDNFKKSPNQSEESYQEQLFCIISCVQSIDNYINFMKKRYTKNVIITGFPGGGKTFCMIYILYDIHCDLCNVKRFEYSPYYNDVPSLYTTWWNTLAQTFMHTTRQRE